jgi:hypothetical protein
MFHRYRSRCLPHRAVGASSLLMGPLPRPRVTHVGDAICLGLDVGTRRPVPVRTFLERFETSRWGPPECTRIRSAVLQGCALMAQVVC